MPDNAPNNVAEKEVQKTVSDATNGLDREISQFEGKHSVTPATQIPVSSAPETKVEVPITVKPEVKTAPEKPPVSLGDFDKVLGLGNNAQNAIKAKAKPSDEKEKDKLEQEKAKTNNPDDVNRGKALGTKTAEQEDDEKAKRPERDFTGFSERETLYLKRMPYEAYEHFKKELTEAKAFKETVKKQAEAYEAKVKALEAGKTILPESYYDNPNSIYLSPEFQEMQQNVMTAKQIEQHWADQLVKVKQGEDWEDLENDPKTGNVVIGKTVKYKDVSDEVRITRFLNNSAQQTANLNNEVQQYVGQFKTRVGERQTKINNVEKEMFPTFDNKESEEYKQTEAIKPIISEKWGILPDNPAFNILAKAVATGLMLKNVLNSMTQKQEVKQEIKEDQRRAGPTNNNFNGGGGGKPTIEPPTIADFEKILR